MQHYLQHIWNGDSSTELMSVLQQCIFGLTPLVFVHISVLDDKRKWETMCERFVKKRQMSVAKAESTVGTAKEINWFGCRWACLFHFGDSAPNESLGCDLKCVVIGLYWQLTHNYNNYNSTTASILYLADRICFWGIKWLRLKISDQGSQCGLGASVKEEKLNECKYNQIQSLIYKSR